MSEIQRTTVSQSQSNIHTEETLNHWIELAKQASLKAYAPYSRFRVGAVAVSETGAVYIGCNVENASFGLTSCAERNAIFHLIASGDKRVRYLVIYTPTAKPTAPCGACRQIANEFSLDARFLAVCDGPERIDMLIDQLLPAAFGPHNLE